nr:winged helix-turn-helix domain-containing protein [uncultured Methanolobus sp.]
MRSSLIDTLFLSEKRKDLLLFLKDGTKSSEDIKEAFDFPWKSMIPQIRKLAEWELINYDKGTCSLTSMGAIIAHNMESLLMTLNVHEKYRDYWLKHDLSPIPQELLYRIGELGECEILEPDIPDIFEQQKEILVKITGSERIMAFVSVHHPTQLIIYSELMEKGTELYLIMTEEVYRTVRKEIQSETGALQIENPMFMSLKKEYDKEIENLFTDSRSNIFVHRGNSRPLNLIVTDSFFSLALLDNAGKYNNSMITSSEMSAVAWGKKLFEHYVKRSEKLTEHEFIKTL